MATDLTRSKAIQIEELLGRGVSVGSIVRTYGVTMTTMQELRDAIGKALDLREQMIEKDAEALRELYPPPARKREERNHATRPPSSAKLICNGCLKPMILEYCECGGIGVKVSGEQLEDLRAGRLEAGRDV